MFSPKQPDLRYNQPRLRPKLLETDSWPCLLKGVEGGVWSNIFGTQCVLERLIAEDGVADEVLVVIGESGTSGTGGDQ